MGNTHDSDAVSALRRKEALDLSEDLSGSQGMGIAESVVHEDV